MTNTKDAVFEEFLEQNPEITTKEASLVKEAVELTIKRLTNTCD